MIGSSSAGGKKLAGTVTRSISGPNSAVANPANGTAKVKYAATRANCTHRRGTPRG